MVNALGLCAEGRQEEEELSEEALRDSIFVNNVRSGDADSAEQAAAFAEIFSYHRSAIYAICLRRIRSHEKALDLTQDVFVQAWRKIDQLKDSTKLAGWLRRIAVRLSINYSVRHKHTLQMPLDADGDISSEGIPGYEGQDRADGFRVATRSESISAVHDTIYDLSDLDQEMLILFYLQGQTIVEMADLLSVPSGTIKRRLFTARSNFKKRIEEQHPEYAVDPTDDL